MKRTVTEEQKSVLKSKISGFKDKYRKRNENLEKYIWRIYEAQNNGLLNLTNEEIGLLINQSEYKDDTDSYLDESAYRKKYQSAKLFYDNVFAVMDGDEYIKELKQAEYELQKTLVKVRDEKNELRKTIRDEARKESFLEVFHNLLLNHSNNIDEKIKPSKIKSSDNDLIVHLTDLHAGILISNFWNTYNEDELVNRLNKYLSKIISISKLHKSEKCYLVIGEIISGLIHENLRAESNLNVTEQFILVAKVITDFILGLSKNFKELHVYITPGNHSRCVAKQSSALKGENFDTLLPYFLKGQLQNYKHIFMHDNDKEESIAMFEVRGQKIMASHGDKDNISTVVSKFSLMFKEFPDIVLLGHRHTNGMKTEYNVKVIQSGCVSGTDNYAVDQRLQNSPEQFVLVVNDKGLECLYDIQLD